jgi:hypothetical protein
MGDSMIDVNKASHCEPSALKTCLGWREWLVLPDLGIPAIKAKIDTGARTSSLHTHFIEPIDKNGQRRVRFGVQPLRKRKDIVCVCESDVLDYRRVKDSGGHSEMRHFIRTTVRLGERQWLIDISLTCRKDMLFRMLLGRKALEAHFVIDPGQSYMTGRQLSRYYQKR